MKFQNKICDAISAHNNVYNCVRQNSTVASYILHSLRKWDCKKNDIEHYGNFLKVYSYHPNIIFLLP